jgi:formylglycine-generating enzyme required for sulfatase activity/tRNA A-37 threonylcarbamoyl transferase component Bud32
LRAATHKKSEHQDGESLAREMIKSGQLTKYQAEQILGGKGKNLCMGQYILLEKLGAGGMGQVYKAYHPGMERVVAIKVILAKGKIDEESVRRFEREVKAAAKLSHPNIITVYDAGNANGRHFMVMELVKGKDLNVIVQQRGGLGVAETINYIKQVARGLEFAHENGVIHRDIKPANLFLDIKGNVKILDMGLAKISNKENEETLSMLTGTTAIMGTVDFMSPEQGTSSRDVDGRSDIYSLGATLFYLLTKKVMYEGDTAFAKVIAHSESPIPSLKAIRPDVSNNLNLIYSKMVAKQVEDRYQNMLELIQELDAIEKGSASTGNLTELSTINSLRDEFGEMDVSRVSSKKVIQSSKSSKAIVKKDYKFVLIATGIGVVLIGIVALAFILGRSINSQNQVTLKSNVANGKAEVLTSNGPIENQRNGQREEFFGQELKISTNNGSFENINPPAAMKDNSGKLTPPITVPKSTASKPNPVAVMPLPSNLLVAPFTEAKAKEAQKEVAKSLQKEVEEKEDLGKGIKLEMVLIPAGVFKMGSPASEPGRQPNETQHEVTLTKPYYLGKHEVTQDQWEAVMGYNPSNVKGTKLPVTMVSWNNCQEFIKKLNAKTNGGYRLPTEAEWEYACRAGKITAYSFGNIITKKDANFGGEYLTPVGKYLPNALGLYDMHGNVWEWCNDWKEAYPPGDLIDPKGPETGTNPIWRGGSFFDNESKIRSSNRDFNDHLLPSDRNDSSGFRLARTVDVKTVVAPTEPKPDPVELMPVSGNLLVSPFSEAKAKEVQKEVAESLKKEVEEKANLGNGVSLEMVLIPAGKFKMMAATSKEYEATLTKPYYIGKYEVTQEQWEAVMGNNPSQLKGAKLPVTNVSWNDCQEFIKKLNAKTSGSYSLPTEAEWEYACRAGTTTAYSFGDSITKSDANYDDAAAGSIKAVGSYKPNPFGLYDMHGNVFEKCEDILFGENRVIRGGSIFANAANAKSSYRVGMNQVYRSNVAGFRLARTP